MAPFAVRVIARAADFGAADDARSVFQTALGVLGEPARADARSALERLGVRGVGLRPTRTPRTSSAESSIVGLSLDELIEGHIYKRRELHRAGLGGNQQKGISYPAVGTYVLLFSDPDTAHEWGYRDSWSGSNGYRYYGEWNGTGDMLIRGGNRAILDRSPEIYLFVKAPQGHRYAGIFECVGHEQLPATRDGREYKALVFTLSRRN
jgi:hypothetical protein